ncbi:MAG: hypothetical protein KIH67_002165 [Candidatus Moranbacteria bacterium]|nr:hypothetical protein [Candidatus Moranbacteria bacterium]
MKKLLFLLVLIGGVYYVLPQHTSLKVKVNAFIDTVTGKKSRFEERSSEKKAEPLILATESRAKTAGYRPILKRDWGVYAVPTAHAAIIMDAGSGDILFEQSAHQRRQIASLTKVYTALLVMQHIKSLDEVVTIPEEIIDITDGTRIGCPRSGFCTGTRLQLGEQLTVRDLLKAALMNSTNDGASALAVHVAGSMENFVKMMNDHALELGLTDSHFCTPSGLEIDGREAECYSSAHDIARITVLALKYPELWDIMRIERDTITSVDGQYSHEVANTNQILGQVPNLLGTKTGFTPLAGYSLLAAVSDYQGERQIVAVVLDDQSRWESIRSMFDWSYQAYEWK